MTARAARKLSRLQKPPDMSLEAWQRELRRQFGREQPFTLKNAGAEPVFSDFHVSNPRSGSVYRVAIRGSRPSDNYCSCPDFATNSLGTCNQVEFVLRKLEGRARTRAMLQRGFQPPFSEVVLQYGAKRAVRFRPGTSCPSRLTALAATYFDSQQILRTNAYAKFESFLSRAAKFDHDLRCYDDVLGFVAEVRDRSRRERRIADAFPRSVRDAGLRTLIEEENREVVAKIVARWRRYRFLSEADQRRLMIALQNMRMSCDSTYLLDHQTDSAVKADELMTLLDDLLEQAGSKIVVFSQWLRMHELLVRRLEKKRVDHVLFHGGVDGTPGLKGSVSAASSGLGARPGASALREPPVALASE